jgi:hypothetical protein
VSLFFEEGLLECRAYLSKQSAGAMMYTDIRNILGTYYALDTGVYDDLGGAVNGLRSSFDRSNEYREAILQSLREMYSDPNISFLEYVNCYELLVDEAETEEEARRIVFDLIWKVADPHAECPELS